MAQGALYTGTYAVNGVNFIIEPSQGKWLPRPTINFDGGGHAIYPAVRSYELDWDFIDMPTWNQLINAYISCSVTGTIIVDLPQFNRVDYYYISYSGATMEEPQLDSYFVGFPAKAKVVFNKIITG